MDLQFSKYQGTGNDFIMIDDRDLTFPISKAGIAKLCHRRFGIGADGLILLQHAENVDFKMVYFNADGHESTMCGNGGRCAITFAKQLDIIQDSCSFLAIDGMHEGFIDAEARVHLKMSDTAHACPSHNAWFINTGSPHHVERVHNVASVQVDALGLKMRNAYGAEGSNVNFVEIQANQLHVRTYERGVEAETLSCGTGVTAAALTAYQQGWISNRVVPVQTPGGQLEVRFQSTATGFTNIWLIGPAVCVFHGAIGLAC